MNVKSIRILEKTKELIEKCSSSNSRLALNDILQEYSKDEDIKNILLYTYDPFKNFFVTSKNVNKKQTTENNRQEHLFILLDLLFNRCVTGNAAISIIKNSIDNLSVELKDVFLRIIDKDLKVGISTKTINKVFKNLIPTFDVCLGEKYKDYENKIKFDGDEWFASRKLDGVRCVAIKENGTTKLFSRQGKPIESLEVLQQLINACPQDNFALDGEVCLMDLDGNENFQGIMKEIRKKNHQVKNPIYNVFDFIPLQGFKDKQCDMKFADRFSGYLKIVMQINNNMIRFVEQIPISNKKSLMDLKKIADSKNWEGLMLRKDVAYKAGRSKDLLKMKDFFDAEYTVLDVECGKITVQDTNKDSKKSVDGVSSLIIKHKGNQINVGSGLSIQQRIDWFKNPQLIIGQTITVKYFEETTNQDGTISLRFPTLKMVHGKEREL